MLASDPTEKGTPRSPLRYSRRDFLILCLGFVGASCASAESTTHTPASTFTPSPSQSTAAASAPYHGTYTGHGGSPVWGVAWSPDGKRIVSVGEDSTAQVWDPDTGRTVLIYSGHRGRVQTVAWSPDGRHIASAGDDRIVHIWDATTGTLQVACRGHSQDILGVA